jgi:IS1 family transposase
MKNLKIDEVCTDAWSSFEKVFQNENHKIGKEFTRNIEGVNNSLRARNRRFVRKTTCFSKKEENHEASIKLCSLKEIITIILFKPQPKKIISKDIKSLNLNL